MFSINTAMQQLAASLAALWPSWVIGSDSAGHMLHFEWVGYGAISMTLMAMWLVGRIRIQS